MKIFAFCMCISLLMAGCSSPVKAVPARDRRVVIVERHWHKKPKKVVVLVGNRIKVRPVRSVVIYYKSVPYLYADGIYYKSVDKEYEVIKPQIGMIVPTLPKKGIKKIKIKDEMFYSYDDVLYKKIVTADGIKFEVQGFVDK